MDDVFFDDLLAALVGLAPDLAWDLPPARRIQLLEHAGAWSDPAAAIDAFVAAATEMVDQYGVPRAARAWVPAWLATTPPAVTADEPLCLEHPLGDIPVAKRACAICRSAAVAEQQRTVESGQR